MPETKTPTIPWDDLRLYPELPGNRPCFSPTPGSITLLAMNPTKTGAMPSPTLISGMLECGFNAAMLNLGTVPSPYLKITSALAAFKDSAIAPFLMVPDMLTDSTARTAIAKLFARDTTLAGWWLDTPGYNQLAGSAAAYSSIWETDHATAPASKHTIVMNAMPQPDIYATYRQYLMAFQDRVKPSMWGTSVFPAYLQGGVTAYDLDTFYGDLEILSLLSRYCERPFWYTVRCQSYTSSLPASCPSTTPPTLEEMRFSAFSALAYGAQGLMCWSYSPLERIGDAILSGVMAPVNDNGVKQTTVWNPLHTVLTEVRSLNSVFHGAFLVRARHTGTRQYRATAMLTGSFGPLVSITTGNEGVLLAHLNTGGRDYLVIVSHAFMKGQPDSQTLTMTFAERVMVVRVNAAGVAPTETPIDSRTVTTPLPRGGYMIFRWE